MDDQKIKDLKKLSRDEFGHSDMSTKIFDNKKKKKEKKFKRIKNIDFKKFKDYLDE